MKKGKHVKTQLAQVGYLKYMCVGSTPKAFPAFDMSQLIWEAVQDAQGSIPSPRPL